MSRRKRGASVVRWRHRVAAATPSRQSVGRWQDWCSVEAVVEEGQRAIRQAHADGRTANGRVAVMAFGGHGGEVFELWSDGEIRPLRGGGGAVSHASA
jgi:hypothetical protein